ncbi:PRC-barrel domain-containing protein [Pseudonocardia xishanensis]|uniref:PRC-barrel domain-containing protein n=1 Tax=Pseudonocardia xishanensis TaxID=630995 RepID=A0ABP8S3X4_9PSEU
MTTLDARELLGQDVLGIGGEALGTVDSVLAEDTSGTPEWVVLTRGGARTAPLPLVDARLDGGALHVPHTLEALRSAPQGPGESLTPASRSELLEHYGVGGVADPKVHPQGRNGPVEEDRPKRDEVAAAADGGVATDGGVPGVRAER